MRLGKEQLIVKSYSVSSDKNMSRKNGKKPYLLSQRKMCIKNFEKQQKFKKKAKEGLFIDSLVLEKFLLGFYTDKIPIIIYFLFVVIVATIVVIPILAYYSLNNYAHYFDIIIYFVCALPALMISFFLYKIKRLSIITENSGLFVVQVNKREHNITVKNTGKVVYNFLCFCHRNRRKENDILPYIEVGSFSSMSKEILQFKGNEFYGKIYLTILCVDILNVKHRFIFYKNKSVDIMRFIGHKMG